jgi:hypothetical protein
MLLKEYIVFRRRVAALVVHSQARHHGVTGSNPPGSVSSALSDSNDFVSLSLLGVLSPLAYNFIFRSKGTSQNKSKLVSRSND